MSHASIQSFYPKALASQAAALSTAPLKAVMPQTQPWKPKGDYMETKIAQLSLGLGKVRLTARIANFASDQEDGRRPLVAQGYHFLVVKDDTGVIAIKLLKTDTDAGKLVFGQLVTIWTAFVGVYSASAHYRLPSVSMIIPVHPSPMSASCIKFHTASASPGSKPLWPADASSLCRLPLGYEPEGLRSDTLPGLVNLKTYLGRSNRELDGTRILVCVRSVGPRKTVVKRDTGKILEVIEVTLFDETDVCVMSLWEDKVQSAKSWIPDRTVLLITNAKCAWSTQKSTKPEISITISSMIEVDPVFPDAQWLRQMAMSKMKKDIVYFPFPKGVWDVEKTMHGPDRALFTLAEIDAFARDDPTGKFAGKMSLVILGVEILGNYRQNKLCCFECCGVSMYANKHVARCSNCQKECHLTLNPRIMGCLADETGSIAQGKLIWNHKAWTNLFFGSENETDCGSPAETWETVTKLDSRALGQLEDELLYERVTLTFGWSHEVGRLCVLGVEW